MNGLGASAMCAQNAPLPVNAPAPISVAIPAHRRVDKLLHTLRVVHACTPPPDEVIVHVDGGTREVHEAVALEFPAVKLMASGKLLGPGGARDTMIRGARHEWVATFDDDSFPERPDFFARVMQDAERFPDAAVLSWDTLPETHARLGFHQIAVFSGCGSILSRRWYLRTQGFVPRVVAYGFEEVDVSLQIHALGGVIVFDPLLKTVHDHHLTGTVPDEVVADTIANVFLFPLVRYPAVLWPLGFAQALKYMWSILCGRRVRAVVMALARLPLDARELWRRRHPVSASAVLGWLNLRRHPRLLPSS